jgi:hypothetical protein
LVVAVLPLRFVWILTKIVQERYSRLN